MATMILLPDGASGNLFNWVANTGTQEDALRSDDGNTSYVACSAAGRYLTLTYDNPSVAEADIASIDSVRFLSSGKAVHRTSPSLVTIIYQVPSGNSAEICSYDAHRTNFETINGNANAYSDGSSADWTYSDLEDLELKCTKSLSIEVYLSYLALEVTYTPAVSADNATFFGANF